MNPKLLFAFAVCGAAGSMLPFSASAQTLEADYELQGTYASSAGTIAPLTVVGATGNVDFTTATVNGVEQQVLNIGADDTGLDATSGVQALTSGVGITAGNYSVELEAEFDLTATGVLATKILDFKNLSADAGLYINDATGVLEFIDNSETILGAGSNGAVTSGTFLNLVLTRSSASDLVSVYENGALAFSFTDSTGLAVQGDATNTGNTYLTLFKDDGTGLGGPIVSESSEGELAQVRIYDGVLSAEQVADLADVPEPGVGWYLAAGFVVLSLVGFRRRARA